MMILNLYNEIHHRIDIIKLADGCLPSFDIGCVVEQSESAVATGTSGPRLPNTKEEYYVKNLEPAVWSVIPLLDKVCVDCQKRRVTWSTKGVEESERDEDNDPSYWTQYTQDECYDYNDDVDQLFELSQELIQLSLSRIKSSRKSQDDLNLIKEEQYFLIRILYCYILPKVRLYKEDLPKVSDAIKRQQSHIEKINLDIERDSQTLDGLYNILKMQQDEWLTEFELIAREDKSCTKRFLKTLAKHLEKRKNYLDDELEKRQCVVNNIKEDIKINGTTPEKESKLQQARKETEFCHKTLKQVLIVSRDAITSALADHEFLERDIKEIVVNYMKNADMLLKQKATANIQLDKKVRATSILENQKRIKNEIESNGIAGSTFHSSAGHRPTDVLPGTYAPEFQTLSERVSAIVKNSEHPLGLEFQKFVNQISKECQEILDQPIAECQKKKKTKPLDCYIVVGHDGSIELEYQSILEKLVRHIKEHFWIMASNFQQHFNNTSNILRNKLQLCYEENFYKEVGKDIMNVYCMLHQHHQQKMTNDLEVIMKLPINCLDLGMKDEWWLKLFENRRKSIISSRYSSCKIPPTNSLPNSLSSQRFSNSMPIISNSLQSRTKKDRQPSRILRFLHLMRRESKAVVGNYSNDPVPDGSDQTNDLSDYEWIQGDFSINNDTHSLGDMSGVFYEEDRKAFDKYFGPSLQDLSRVFRVSSILGKLQCLTSSLKKVTNAVQELRQQVLKNTANDENALFSIAISGDDMLPLIVLMILQLEPNYASALQAQLKMMQDLIPEFLSAGCHGWAMMEFQMACQVLQNLCRDFSWDESFNDSSMAYE